jgi:hypothetical protein
MKNLIVNIPNRTAAKITGLGIFILLIAGSYVFFALNTGLEPPGESAVAAANNIKVNLLLFIIVIAGILIMIICNLVLALTFYLLLKHIIKDLSLLAAILRLIYTIVFAISMVFLFIEPLLFSSVFLTGQIFFAIYLLVLGYIVFKSGYIPRILGILLIIGGTLGYLTESLTSFFSPNYIWISSFGIMVAVIAEIIIGIWLLVKNDKIAKMIEERMIISEE